MNVRNHRLRQIAEILLRHGWGFLLDVAGLEHLSAALSGSQPRHDSPTRPEHLRLALEELGPTFVKIGQLLSTRADLLAPEYRIELAKLQDAAPRLPPEVIQQVLGVELDGGMHSVFATFDPEPLAAASIGQAHAATLHDGTEVVVKIRRPGAVEEVRQDLEILLNLAARASRHWEAAARYDIVGLAEEFAQMLRAQLDYLREGRNAERFAASFADDPDVQIPRVFWEATTSRVITLGRIRGMKITDLAALETAGLDRRELVQQATRVVGKTVFEDGFFHADPHPGNFFIQPDGRIGIIDFGLVGILDDRLRDQLGRLMIALARENADRVAETLIALGTTGEPVDRARLRDDLAGLLARYSGRRINEIPLGTVGGEILEIVRRHGLRAPRDLALLIRTFVMEEGIAAELDPEFRLIKALTPYAYRHLAAELSPVALARRLGQIGVDLAELTVELPGQLHRALDVLASGSFEVHLRAGELERLVARGERLGNRLAASVLAAATIDALAGLAAADGAHSWYGRTLKVTAIVGGLGALSAYALRTRTLFHRRVRNA